MMGPSSIRSPDSLKSSKVNGIGKSSDGNALQYEASMRKFSSTALTTLSPVGPAKPVFNLSAKHQTMKTDVLQPQLQIITDPRLLPTPSIMSTLIPVHDFSVAPHKFPGSIRRVDSRLEAKSTESTKLRSDVSMEFLGSSFTNMPNAHRVTFQSPPRAPKLAKPYAPLAAKDFLSSPMLHNRTASGSILGATARRYISAAHVPYIAPEEPLGPDNPYQALNDTWTKCWDNEAGAVYYYNNVTGEATWLQPEL
jgi:hypothetical protein